MNMNGIIIRLKIIFLLGAVILSHHTVAQKVSKVHLQFVKVGSQSIILNIRPSR